MTTLPILYHCADARSLRCLWAVEEAGIEVDLRLLKFPPRAFEPDYRAVNPLMTVPGYPVPALDDVWHLELGDAVEVVQLAAGIDGDRIVGPVTLEALQAAERRVTL